MWTNINPKDFPYEIILDWYEKHGRHDLPWREDFDPYKVWISEIFLQQTQVSRVKEYFIKVIEAFPTIYDFSKLEYEDFFPYYSWLWYYSRARNMLKTAKIIVENYNWIFPKNYHDLVSLPWIWPYTAQAILSFWYDEKVLAFDVNIEKIFSRFYYGTRFHKLTNDEKKALQENFASRNISARSINAALMDFSSLLDLNEKNLINFEKYPLKNSVFFQELWEKEITIKKSKNIFDAKKAQIVVFLHENHKIYFSSDYDAFKPFYLDSTFENHREYIKNYFLKNFDLSVSVRPAHKKFEKFWKIFFYFNAQIQTGKSQFAEFWKAEKDDWEQKNNDF